MLLISQVKEGFDLVSLQFVFTARKTNVSVFFLRDQVIASFQLTKKLIWDCTCSDLAA